MTESETIRLSVIVPVDPKDEAWRELLPQLSQITVSTEVVLAISFEDSRFSKESLSGLQLPYKISRAKKGRASQMNAAALISAGDYIWFLHSDSRLTVDVVSKIESATLDGGNALYYFDLRYMNDGPMFSRLNAFGANIRSKYFGIPFGDQGFLIRKELFTDLGGYPVDCQYGEDHLFVWKVKRNGLSAVALKAALFSSARKYQENGWLRTTIKHARLFLAQVLFEIYRGLLCRIRTDSDAQLRSL